jgi:tetratricopeptide (TPR) repeat protein
MTASSSSRVRPGRRRLVAVSAIVVIALVVSAWWFFLRGQVEPPRPDLTGVDPAVRDAIEEARAEVRKAPRSADAWGRLGMVLSVHVFGADAVACFAEAEKLDPKNPRWPYHQGLIQLAYDPPTALPQLARAVELEADQHDAPRVRLAELCLWLGRSDEARSHFQTLVARNPKHPRALLGLARLEYLAGDTAASRKHLAIPLGHPLTRKSALTLSAELYQREGDTVSAQRERARMIGLPDEPEWPDAYVQETLPLKVGESPRLQLAGQLLDRRRYPEATRLLRQVVTDYPNSATGWMLLGWALLDQGQLPAAAEALDAALKLDDTQPRAWLYRGAVHFARKERSEAIACFRKAADLKPSYLQAHFNLGTCLKEEGDEPGAIAAFQNAVRAEPLSAPAHANLGALLVKTGRPQAALEHLEQAVALNPDDTASRKLLDEARTNQSPNKKPG